jgi:hypothetical protein
MTDIAVFDDYVSVFRLICDGLDKVEPNLKIIGACLKSTEGMLTKESLKLVGDNLGENCRRHPVRADFLKACSDLGIKTKKTIVYDKDYSYIGTCSAQPQLCNGDGYLYVRRPVGDEILMRCVCRAGHLRNNSIPQWSGAYFAKGYRIKDKWGSVDAPEEFSREATKQMFFTVAGERIGGSEQVA